MAADKKTIVVGSDHAGFPMKGLALEVIRDLGYAITDVGSYDDKPVDFPDVARALCTEILEGRAERGIMVCGTGVGAAIATNKVRGIRAAVCHDVHSAHQGVEHDNVNVMCIGAQIVGAWLARDLFTAFLKAEFDPREEHVRRVCKLSELEGDL
ncbi:ribose 5-phosphate isomerase B [Rhodobium orientis]|uniref:Ribose-5-phosphate isomerase n=1 Tax=Rhodobium orientis TaxID=34017 RepID=A0A327JGG5_9HYPH|nr:RpiB/LacA/LacB family sugar-phosphate isomerase [Rhodobium orientis]MBB4301657.1 ribose 5-phosphate isomerase B [Rhodobium orientis]MBK5952352.1 ribose-5-phosphate isomerase [Rhodobium orientis]RAI25419.1 ribose-5-phosphate isomerase [Rhodobium orientis]